MNDKVNGRKESEVSGSSRQDRLDRLAAEIKKREAQKVVKLPEWSDEKRGTPNSFIRSALFSCIRSKDRVFYKEQVLFSQKNTQIIYTGEQLNQEDLTVWETMVHISRDTPLGVRSVFPAHSILQSMSMATGGDAHKRLHSSLIRQTACAIEIIHDDKEYFGSLLVSGVKDKITKHYDVVLNKKLIALYGRTQWTAINWKQRLQLRRKPLAQGLHALYSSHREPFPMKLETLRAITGGRSTKLKNFRTKVIAALGCLEDINFLTDYSVDNGLVSVTRTPVLPRDM